MLKVLPQEKRLVKDLILWDDNPRDIQEDDFNRLKYQIQELGFFGSLLINSGKNWGTTNVVLGGNTRLRALLDLGVEEVLCSIANPANEGQAIEYALAHNDSTGKYNKDSLAELLFRNDNIPMDMYKASFGDYQDMQSVANEYGISQVAGDADDGIEVLVQPPEAPFLKNKVSFRCETIEDFEQIKQFFETDKTGKLATSKLLGIVNNE
jgi:hypothetical protein